MGTTAIPRVLAAVLLLAAPTVGTGLRPAAARGPAPPPEPVLVGPGEPVAGVLDVAPAVQVAADGQASWVLRNGGDGPLTAALAVHVLAAGDGTPEPGPVLGGLLARPAVTLAAGEQARIRARLPADVDVVTLVATTVATEPVVEVSGVAVRGGPVDVGVRAGIDGDAAVVVLEPSAPTVAAARVRARAWPGITLSEADLDDVLVLPPARRLELPLPAGAAGRLSIDVALRTVGGRTVRATDELWRWPTPVPAMAVLFLAAAVAAVVVVRRRRGAGPAGPSSAGPGSTDE